MDIYLDKHTSLHLLREAARNPSLSLLPTDKMRPEPLNHAYIRLNRLEIPGLIGYLRVPEDRRLGIIVPSARNRVRAQGIECAVDACKRDGAPFLLLSSADPKQPSPLVPACTRVYVQSPQLIVLGMARQLRRLELEGRMQHERAVLMLLKLCLELCGTYAHDPFLPHEGEVAYGTQPLLSAETLREYLQPEGSEQGLSLAREVAALAYDRSGSPQESFMGSALFGESRLGGLALCAFEPNASLELSPAERAAIDHRTITPDFTLKPYRSVVEYLGVVHEKGDNPEIDHVRSLDYQTLAYREFAFTYDDVRTQAAFMASAARLVTVIEQYDGPGIRQRFNRLARDPQFSRRQRVLFEVFRPWLRYQ